MPGRIIRNSRSIPNHPVSVGPRVLIGLVVSYVEYKQGGGLSQYIHSTTMVRRDGGKVVGGKRKETKTFTVKHTLFLDRMRIATVRISCARSAEGKDPKARRLDVTMEVRSGSAPATAPPRPEWRSGNKKQLKNH